MESTIIELSQYSSNNVIQNGEWTNTLCKSVTVGNGDYISVKQGMIDLSLVTSSSILIENDVEWTLSFVYYANGHGLNQSNNNISTQTTVGIDGLPYVLTEFVTIADRQLFNVPMPIVDNFVVKVPKGIYDRTFLAEFISRQFQTVGKNNSVPLGQGCAINNQCYSNGSIYSNNNISGEFISFNPPINTPQSDANFITSLLRPIYVSTGSHDSLPKPPTGSSYQMFYIKNNSFLAPDNGDGMNVNYVPCVYVPLCTNTNLGSTTIAGYANFSTALISGISGTGGAVNTDYFNGIMIGASQVSLTYNDLNSGRYGFQYLHSPITNSISGSISEVTGVHVYQSSIPAINLVSQVCYLNCYSGIMFVDMKTNLSSDPNNDPFFKQLGLNYSDIIPDGISSMFSISPDPVPANYGIDYLEFLRVTTRNYIPRDSLINVTETTTAGSKYKYEYNAYLPAFTTFPSSADTYFFTDSPDTSPVTFSNPPISSLSNAGHYLVEISNYHSDYVNNNDLFNVKATIASFYLSGDSFVVSMGQDSYIYQNSGVPLSLNNIKIRILNPVTKEVQQNMGPNTTIYLQVTRDKPQPPEVVTDKSKDKDKDKDKKE
jgi:hypothetical protein